MMDMLEEVTTSDGTKFFDFPRNEISQRRYTEEHRILDIFCKSGNFLEAAHYRFMRALHYKIPDPIVRSEYIMRDLLYGVGGVEAITSKVVAESSLKLIRQKFYGSKEIQGNIYKDIKDLREENKYMNFAVVLGNPPYNNDLYLKFVQLGNKICMNCSMWVTPAKWQAKGGDDNEAFRQSIVPYMSKIVFYPDCIDVFAIGDPGGISYYLIDKEKQALKNIKNVSYKQKIYNDQRERF
jgi:hypothetical protein